jgi:Cof subfamily protein (haloacid dehalogenase superfamily)
MSSMPFQLGAALSTPTDDPYADVHPGARLTAVAPASRGLLVIDLDGTIVDARGLVDPLAADAIGVLQDGGIKVVLATGRSPWSGVADLARVLDLSGPHITMQGALVLDPWDGEVFLARALPATVYLEALQLADELGLDPVVGLVDGYRAERLPEWAGADSTIQAGRRIRHVDDLTRLTDEPPFRLLLPTTVDRHEKVRRKLMAWFEDRASITWNDQFGVEVLGPGVDKGTAMVWLAERYGIALEKTVAIGDARNDIGMLLRAGRSAAMGSAPAEVRKAADIVVPPVDEHGAVEAMRWFYPDLLADVSRVVEPRGADWDAGLGRLPVPGEPRPARVA